MQKHKMDLLVGNFPASRMNGILSHSNSWAAFMIEDKSVSKALGSIIGVQIKKIMGKSGKPMKLSTWIPALTYYVISQNPLMFSYSVGKPMFFFGFQDRACDVFPRQQQICYVILGIPVTILKLSWDTGNQVFFGFFWIPQKKNQNSSWRRPSPPEEVSRDFWKSHDKNWKVVGASQVHPKKFHVISGNPTTKIEK